MGKLFTLLTLFTVLLFDSSTGQELCPIIPKPKELQKAVGTFVLSHHTLIIVESSEALAAAQYLQKEVLRTIRTPLSIQRKSSGNGIVLRIQSGKKKLKSEEYEIEMSNKQILLSASEPSGLINGVSSLLQLIKFSPSQNNSYQIQCWNIKDAPLYSWRGIMLDESRHFFGKEKVKELLNWMAFYKLNRFHWHLTDVPGWRLEIKQYPKLALIGGVGNHSDPFAKTNFYSQEDIKEIVQYAAERNISIIPEIDMPGHATAANRAYPEFSGGGSLKHPDFTFNPGKESVYQYLTSILKEADVLFPSKMIHLGGDEVHFGNEKWKTDTAVLNLMSEKKLADLKAVESYFIQRMADSVVKLNSKVAAWDEVAGASFPVKETLIFWWRHDRPEQLKLALDKGYSTVLCPRIPLYFDFVQDSTHLSGRKWSGNFSSLEKIYAFSDSQIPVIKGKNHLVAGIQANLWTETIASPKRLEYMTFPRIGALAESAWTDTGNRDFQQFSQRLKNHLLMYQKEGIYFYNPFAPNSNPEIIDIPKAINLNFVD